MNGQTLYVRLVADLSQYGPGMGRAASDVDRVGVSADRTGQRLSRLGKTGLLAVATGLALVAHEAVGFDTAMRNVNSISGMSERQLADTSKAVIALSKHLPQSATTLAKGLYDIASSGFQGAQGLEVLRSAAISASAGMSDTATAAQAITAVLNAYQLSSSHAADVSDILFQTVNKGVITFGELANGVGQYIGQAHVLGVSFSETGAALATMTLNGIAAEQVSHVLGATLNGLIKPSVGLSKVLHDAGYASGSAAVQALGLRGTLELVAKASGGTAEGMSRMFNDTVALRGALATTSGEGKKYAEISGQIVDAHARQGAAAKALVEQSKAAGYQLTLIRNQAVDAALGLAQMAMPAVVEFLHDIQSGGHDAAQALSKLADALGPAFDAMGATAEHLWNLLSDLGSAVEPLASALGSAALTAAIATFTGLADAAAAVVGFLDDNRAAAVALAIVVAGMLGPGLVTLIRLQAGLIRSSIALWAAQGKAGVEGLTAALRGLATAEGVATLGLTVVIAAGLSMWAKNKQLIREGREQFQQFTQDIQYGDRGGFERMRKNSLAFMQQQLETSNNLADTIGRLDGFTQALNDAGDKEKLAEANLMHLRGQLPLTGDAILKLAKAAGVDLTGNVDDARHAIVTLYNKTVAADAPTQRLTTSLETMGDAAASSTDKVSALSDALNALIGVNLDADAAAAAYQAALDKVTASAADNGHSLDLTTEKGRANRDAFRDAASAIVDHIDALAKQGIELDKLPAKYTAEVAGLAKTARAAGFTTDQVSALLKAYGLTPDVVKTIIQQSGADTVESTLQHLDKTKHKAGEPITIKVHADTSAAIAEITAIGKNIPPVHVLTTADLLTGGFTPPKHKAAGGLLHGPGTGTSDSIPILASNGEFIVNAAATSRHLGLLQSINGRRFASGGQVRYNPRGGSLEAQAAGIARGGGGVDQVQALIDSYNEYLHKLDQVRQREELIANLRKAQAAAAKAQSQDRASATQAVSDAVKALADFDRQAAQEAQGSAAQKVLDRLQRSTELQQQRYQIEDNLYALGRKSAASEIASLTARMASARKYSDEWMALYNQRKQVEDDEAARRQQSLDDAYTIFDNQYKLGKRTDAEEIASLTKRMAAEKAYSAAWMQLYQQRQEIIDAAAAAQQKANDDALSALNGMLDQVDQLHAQQLQNEQDYATKQADLLAQQAAAEKTLYEGMAKAAQDYAARQGELVAARASALADSVAADAKITSSWGSSVTWLTQNVMDQVGQFQAWTDALAQARQRGVSEAVIGALGLDEGPQKLDQLKQFSNATQAEIDALNAAVAAKQAAAQRQATAEQTAGVGKLGADLADAQKTYGETVAGLQQTYQDTVAELAKQTAEAEAEFLAKQRDLTAQLAKVGRDQGRTYADALAQGLASGLPAVQAAAQALAAAATGGLAAVASGGGGGAPGLVGDNGTNPYAAVEAMGGDVLGGGAYTLTIGPDGKPMFSKDGHSYSADDVTAMFKARYGYTYDSGGVLQPGYTLAYNGTGRPEAVLTAAQMAGLVGDTTVRVFIGERELTDLVRVEREKAGTARRTANAIAGSRG